MTSLNHEMMELRPEMVTARLSHTSTPPTPPVLHAAGCFWCWKLFVGITVAWDDLGMGGIASFALHQWDGMVATDAQLVSLSTPSSAMRNSPSHWILCLVHQNDLTGCLATWHHYRLKHNLFQLPTETLPSMSWYWKVTGVKPTWPLLTAHWVSDHLS